MALPTRIQDHLLFVTAQPADRLTLYQRVVSTVRLKDGHLIAAVGEGMLGCVKSAIELARIDPRRITAQTVDEMIGSAHPAWQGFCSSTDNLVAKAHSRGVERQLTLLIDLDAVFARCQAASEMMSVLYHLDRELVSHGRTVACVVSVESLPKSLPPEFFDVHCTWAFGEIEGRGAVTDLDSVAEQFALASPEFRQRFLASARDGSEMALPLVPRFLDDYRRGILMVDRRFMIRFCSPKAAELLGKSADDVMDRAISTCVDGVDLVTVKHECEKLKPGRASQSPFIASWRITPGVYEPREVSVDPVRSGHQTVGYIIALSHVEAVRGPRAVYQQLKAEKAGSSAMQDRVEEDVLLTEDEAVSGDLHGTQITRREHEIILLILKDMTNRQIADHLSIAEVTVKKHLTSVYRKLRITSRRELTMSFARPGSES
ncbi:MAG: PAS and helix-turn-helix domain-containing protein [Spirochaetales bacterium]|nr:PAS and helix-turn-helix domain-containing protein [Spirochaetales bacterium]